MDTPDIVKELRETERLGKLTSRSSDSHKVFDTSTTFPASILDRKELDTKKVDSLTRITEYKTTEEELKIKDSAIASSINAIAIANLDGNLTYVNRSFLNMWGYHDEREILGQTAVKFWQMKGQYVEIMDTLTDKGGWVGELVAERQDGSTFDVQLSSTMVKDNNGKSICMMASFVDITDRKRAEEKLALLNRDLEQKVKERTEQVEKLLKQKDEFIGQLGHDIKTPLTPLVTLLPIIKKKEQDPKLKELLDVAVHNVATIKELVVKTLELARLNSTDTKFDTEDTCLPKTAEKIINDHRTICEANSIKIENNIGESIIVKADKLRLREVFDNLITNAIKFTPDNGTIIIDANEEDGTVTVSVKDTGIGLTEEQLDRIFDEFYKADNSRHDLDSSGLGLAICKRIVEKHGGKIWAESPGPGKGSTLYFTLNKTG